MGRNAVRHCTRRYQMKSANRFCVNNLAYGVLVITLLIVLTWLVVPATASASAQVDHAVQTVEQQTVSSAHTIEEIGLETVKHPGPAITSLTHITATGEIIQVLETGDGCRTVRAVSAGDDLSPRNGENSVLECETQARELASQAEGPVPDAAPPAPVLLLPANNSTVNTLLPLLRIDARVSNVEISPNIWLSQDPNFGQGSNWVMFCGWTQSSSQFQYTFFNNLIPNTRYYWRARSGYGDGCVNPNLQWSPWSPTWSFVSGSNGTILPAPQLVSPLNGSTITDIRPTLTWRSVAGANGTFVRGRPVYQIDPRDYGWGIWWNSVVTSARVYRDLTLGETYEWYVEFKNDYAWGLPSSRWRFTIGTSYSISGRVTINGNNGLAGVTISDGAGHTTTTGSDGRYTLSNLSAGTYAIRASKTGYVFSPVSRSVTVPPNATGIDFTGVGAYQVSGRVTDSGGQGVAGVLVSAGTRQGTTDNNGNYTITGLESGSFTVTPSRSGYSFCPRSRTTAVPPNQTGRNFTGSPVGTDLGLCPDPNGFRFANKKLWRTWPMFEQFYGSAQVLKPDGSKCFAAQQYFDQTYLGVADGWSCFGFTLSSLHSFQSRPQPNAGPFAIAHYDRLYDQPESRQLTDPIAYYSGVQLSQQYQSEYQSWLATCDTDPNQMVERLRQAIQAGSPLLLGLNAGNVYHAITPYRIVTVSSNETHIYVYDSEAPGQQRVVRLQRSGSGWQWQYTFTGSLTSAGTKTGGCRDMYYYQAITSLEHGLPLEDLCTDTRVIAPDGTSTPAGTGRMLSVLPATGDWIVQDGAGHRLGWTGGQWVAEIPNGYELPQTFGDATLSYRALYLPAGGYTVRASSGSSRQIDYSLFADGRVLEVSGKTSAASIISEIDVLPGLDAISVTRPADLASLVIDMTHEMPTVSRVAGLTGSTISGNDDLAISFDGQEMQLSRASGEMQYRLRFFQPGSSSGYFVTEPITLGADEAHTLAPANWIGLTASTVTLEIDEGRNGTIDETVTLENAARSIYLPAIPGS